MCAGIYSVLHFKLRDIAWEQRGQSLQSESEWSQSRKASERNLSLHYAFFFFFFNAPVSLFPILIAPPQHFPPWLRQRGVSIGSPVLNAFQCYASPSSSPPHSVVLSLLFLHPSFFISSRYFSLSLDSFIFPYPSPHPHPSALATREISCSWLVIAKRKADIQLLMSSY